jgi:aerobic-type carbon monoxide dehydrogenase small subunit (CoxS/CutS family)
MTAKALLDKEPSPSPQRIKEAMSGNLCRCTGYQQIVESVERAAVCCRDADRVKA